MKNSLQGFKCIFQYRRKKDSVIKNTKFVEYNVLSSRSPVIPLSMPCNDTKKERIG